MTDDELIEAAIASAVGGGVLGESEEMRRRLDAPDALGKAARYYAGIGWPVFPCAPGDKVPMTANGLHDATTDVVTVAAWWAQTPHANIGVPTGFRFDVVDVDAPEGFDGLARLQAEAGERFPRILAVAHTGSGGRHLLITPQAGMTNRARIAPGVDYRARGGYVVVPPSRLTMRARYRWLVEPHNELIEGAT